MTQSQKLTPAELIKEQEDQRLFAEWCDFIEEKKWDYYTQSLYLEEPRRPPKVLHLWPPKLLHPAWGDLMH